MKNNSLLIVVVGRRLPGAPGLGTTCRYSPLLATLLKSLFQSCGTTVHDGGNHGGAEAVMGTPSIEYRRR